MEIRDAWRSSAAMRARRVGDSDLVVSSIAEKDRPARLVEMCMHEGAPGAAPSSNALNLRSSRTVHSPVPPISFVLILLGSHCQRGHGQEQAARQWEEEGFSGQGDAVNPSVDSSLSFVLDRSHVCSLQEHMFEFVHVTVCGVQVRRPSVEARGR